jgi:hypothetical protein
VAEGGYIGLTVDGASNEGSALSRNKLNQHLEKENNKSEG